MEPIIGNVLLLTSDRFGSLMLERTERGETLYPKSVARSPSILRYTIHVTIAGTSGLENMTTRGHMVE